MKWSTLLVLSCFLFLFSYSCVSAQIGIKAGPAVSDIAFKVFGQTPYLGYESNQFNHRLPMLTWQAGVFGRAELGDRFGLQPELLFITQGLDYSEDFLYENMTYRLKVSYLHVPVLLKYQLSKKREGYPAILVGPYASWKLRATRITEYEGVEEKAEMPNVRSADLGLVTAYAAGFDLGAGKLIVDLRGSYSLVNMMDRVEGYIPSYEDPGKAYARNISLTLTVGYQFLNFDKKRR